MIPKKRAPSGYGSVSSVAGPTGNPLFTSHQIIIGHAARDRGAIEAMTRKEFPTLSAAGVKATLDRIYADHIWSTDGMVAEKGYALDMDVVAKTGAFTKSVPYNDVVDMQFVQKALQKR